MQKKAKNYTSGEEKLHFLCKRLISNIKKMCLF